MKILPQCILSFNVRLVEMVVLHVSWTIH